MVLVLLCGGVGAETLDRVVLQLKWRHQFQFAGYYAAIQQGYYREEGLEVELREALPGRDHVDEVFTGRAQYGVGNSDLLLSRAAGAPAVVLAPIFQHSPLVLVARDVAGIDFYGDTLFTTEEHLKRHPEQVRAFLRASLRGWDYALAHPEEVVDLILAGYSTLHTREQLLFEAGKTAELMHPGLIEVGHNNPGRWRRMADTYAESGLLPRGFSLDGFLYDPEPTAGLHVVCLMLGVLAVAAVGAWGWILPLRRLNARLRREIVEHARTEEALRIARDEAERTSAEKSRFIAFISHEVRTPLGGFVGLIDLLREAPLTADQSESLELMEHSANNLVSLISNALEQEKIAAGRIEVHPCPVVLGEILTSVGDLFRGIARQRGLQLVVSHGQALPDVIHTDPHRLRQILQNLVSNALKFTIRGSVTIHAENASPGHVRILVKDTGPGVRADRLERIFEPYAQGDSLVAREHGGTGLGLPISRQLARLLGGELTVLPHDGTGAAFALDLPVGQTDETA